MNQIPNDMKASSIQLLPHQEAFVETFFSPASKRIIVLRGSVGLGKGTALLGLCDRLLRERTQARVLTIVPGIALRAQFAYRLREAGVPTLELDRYRFRELIDSTAEKEIWPIGGVTVVSGEFARLEDISHSLASIRWDLLIVDEAHQFRGLLARDVVWRVGGSSERIILSALPSVDLPDGALEQDATVVEWNRDHIVGYDGKPLSVTPRPALHEVRYDLSPTERSLAETVNELCRLTESGTTQQAWIAKSWVRRFESSPAALEAMLQKVGEIRSRAARENAESLVESPESEESLEVRPENWLDAGTTARAAEIASRLAQEIESLGVDSKLSAFAALLNQLEAANRSSRRICVLTQYVATVFYLASEIEVHGMHSRLLHGNMAAEDRQRSIELFVSAGGVLTATSASVSEGVVLPEVTDLVLYDIPGSNTALRQVIGRFDRFGRRSQLNVYALLPPTDTFSSGSESKSIELLHQVLGKKRPEDGR